jgi:hypothetical protein
MPYVLKLDPMREKFRMLKEEPKLTKSKTERLEPTLPIPYNDNERPQREKDRRDKVEPNPIISSKDRELPIRTRP